MAASVDAILVAVKSRADKIINDSVPELVESTLDEIMLLAAKNAIGEISQGADSEEFASLAVINFVILADHGGHSIKKISSYLTSLGDDYGIIEDEWRVE